jgi:predicted GH43/DUF377 family glycosyl hydrolase
MFVGFDGRGYQTGLACSEDLVEWRELGVILARAEGRTWDSGNAAGTWLLCDDALRGPRRLKKWQDRYWMAYHAYPGVGYEAGPARIGLAWTDDDTLMSWRRVPDPILIPEEGAAWERGGLYKECLVEQEGVFHLFYNAKDCSAPWFEQIGLAQSDDLRTWVRSPDNPLVRVTPGAWDSRFSSDPCVVRDGDDWVMFYYGFDGEHAQEGLAFSGDLHRWRKHPAPILRTGAPGSLDSIHAHKPSVIVHEGVLYHFYCAVRPSHSGDPAENLGGEFRSITVAASHPVFERSGLD